MKKSFAVLLLCLIYFFSVSQSGNTGQKIPGIGEQVPDIRFQAEQHQRISWVKMSDFRGKMVILDFWATYCASCLEAFPRLDSLQKLYGKSLQIILVNTQPKTAIESYLAVRRRQGAHYDLPDLLSVTNDRILNKVFKHTLIPHEVWIDAHGKLCAVTDARYVTGENIRNKLQNTAFGLPQKYDFLEHDVYKPLTPQLFSPTFNPLQYYSSILKYVPGLDGTTVRYAIDSVAGTVRMTRNPEPILMLYADALSRWQGGFNYPFESDYYDYGKRLVLEVNDSNDYIRPAVPSEAWNAKHCFGYEAVWPLRQADSLYDFMIADLNRYFNVYGRLEKKTMKTMAIVRTSNEDKIKAQYDKAAQGREDSTLHFRRYDINFKVFRNRLAEYYRNTNYIFVDNTSYTGYIDLELSADMTDLSALKKELREKYDLDIIEKIQPVDVMIITERSRIKKIAAN